MIFNNSGITVLDKQTQSHIVNILVWTCLWKAQFYKEI